MTRRSVCHQIAIPYCSIESARGEIPNFWRGRPSIRSRLRLPTGSFSAIFRPASDDRLLAALILTSSLCQRACVTGSHSYHTVGAAAGVSRSRRVRCQQWTGFDDRDGDPCVFDATLNTQISRIDCHEQITFDVFFSGHKARCFLEKLVPAASSFERLPNVSLRR